MTQLWVGLMAAWSVLLVCLWHTSLSQEEMIPGLGSWENSELVLDINRIGPGLVN